MVKVRIDKNTSRKLKDRKVFIEMYNDSFLQTYFILFNN